MMIVPLQPDDLHRIWLASETHFTTRALRQHLERYPHLGWMVRENADYIVGGYWKDRPEIGLIMESSPSSQRDALVQRLLQSYRETGSDLVIISEREVTHSLHLYQGMGFAPLEEVVCYERPNVSVPPLPRRLSVRRLEEDDLAALVTLERAAFPWLWWETATNFRQADQKPEISVHVAYLGHEMVGYLVLVVRGTWGHVNRIGVHPSRQGQGFGRELLAVAIEEMARNGARTVGLNTQSTNLRSQRLYDRFGFKRTGEKFKIWGKWLDAHNPDPESRRTTCAS
jgi:ribosomal protein S18 acetylase RimI-like enzyme